MKENQTTFAILILSLAAIFIVIWGIQSTASILNPILLAAVITVVMMPVPAKLTDRGLPGWLAFILTLLAVVAVIALVLLLVFGTISQLTDNLSIQTSTSGSTLISSDQVNRIYGAIVRWAGQAAVLIFMVFIIFIFMLSAAISMPAANRLGLDVSSSVLEQVSKLTEDVRRYMSIMTGINFLVGVGDAILLWILGVEYAILWGLLAWFMGYIPTVGFWIAMIPPLILAWTEQGPQTALFVFLGYVLINGSVQNFVQPRMMGQGLGISPVVVFISLFVWGFLLGGVGAILAVPLTMLVMAVLNSFPNTRWIAVLMSTPGHGKEDGEDEANYRQEAQDRLRQTWHGVRKTFGRDDDVQDDVVLNEQ